MIGEILILILLWLFDSTIRHYILILSKFLSEDNKEPIQPLVAKKPEVDNLSNPPSEIFEFEALEDIAENVEESYFRRKAIQKAICILHDSSETDVEVRKWQFICKVCNKAFESIKLCEAHIIKNEHTFLFSENTDEDDFDLLQIQLERLRRMNDIESFSDESEKTFNGIDRGKPICYDRQLSQDFIPIHFGNWSKVICELRHRFGQACHENCKYVNTVNIADLDLLKDQTFPKTIQKVLQGPNRTPQIQEECLLRSSCPETTTIKGEDSKVSLGSGLTESKDVYDQGEDHNTNTKGSRASTETELSELTVPSDVDQPKEPSIVVENASRTSSTSSETANCQIEKVKVCVDFITRLLYCESCYSTFRTIDQAFTHFKTDGDSDKSADQYTWDEYDVLHQNSNDKLEVQEDKVRNDCEIQLAGTNHDVQETEDKAGNFSGDGTQQDEEKAQTPSEKPPLDFPDTLQSSKHDFENLNDADSLDYYSEKIPLFESPTDKVKEKRKKKKKKKTWRMVKRSIIYAIIFFF